MSVVQHLWYLLALASRACPFGKLWGQVLLFMQVLPWLSWRYSLCPTSKDSVTLRECLCWVSFLGVPLGPPTLCLSLAWVFFLWVKQLYFGGAPMLRILCACLGYNPLGYLNWETMYPLMVYFGVFINKCYLACTMVLHINKITTATMCATNTQNVNSYHKYIRSSI